MGGFDQVVLGLYAAILAALSLVAVLVAAGWQEPVRGLGQLLTGPEARVGLAAVGVLFFLVSLRLLILLRPRRVSQALVRESPLGEIRVALTAVEGLIAREGRQVEGVRELKARILPGSTDLRVEVRAWIGANVHVPDLCDRLQQTVRQKVQSVVGADVSEVRVVVRDIGGELRRRRVD